MRGEGGGRLFLPAFLFLGAFLALLWASPKLKVSPLLGVVLGAVAFTSLIVGASFCAGASGALLCPLLRCTWLFLSGAALFFSYRHEVDIALDASLLLSGVGLALVVAPLLREKNLLVPVALVAALVDLWGVTTGPVAVAMEEAPEVVERASVGVTALGTMKPVLFIGPGDLFFSALFGATITRLGLRALPTLLWMMGLLNLAALGTLFGPAALPALPFMALAIFLSQWREFRLSRGEKMAVALVTTALACLLALFSAFGRGR